MSKRNIIIHQLSLRSVNNHIVFFLLYGKYYKGSLLQFEWYVDHKDTGGHCFQLSASVVKVCNSHSIVDSVSGKTLKTAKLQADAPWWTGLYFNWLRVCSFWNVYMDRRWMFVKD